MWTLSSSTPHPLFHQHSLLDAGVPPVLPPLSHWSRSGKEIPLSLSRVEWLDMRVLLAWVQEKWSVEQVLPWVQPPLGEFCFETPSVGDAGQEVASFPPGTLALQLSYQPRQRPSICTQVGLLVLHWLELSPHVYTAWDAGASADRRRSRWKRKWVWGRVMEAWPALPAAWKALAKIFTWLVALWQSELSLNVTSSERLSLNSESKTATLTLSITSLCFNSWNSECHCEMLSC